jgi:hypothetical protein
MSGLSEMSRDARGRIDIPEQKNGGASGAASSKTDSAKKEKQTADSRGRVTRTIKGQKDVVVVIAALEGKGYPAPVDLDAGAKPKPGRRRA